MTKETNTNKMEDTVIDPIQCPRCDYKSPANLLKSVALAVFTAHVTAHSAPPATPTPAATVPQAPRGQKLDRPKVGMGISKEDWNVFKRRWDAYVIGSGLDAADCSSQLFGCTDEKLGDTILKSPPQILTKATSVLVDTMEKLGGNCRIPHAASKGFSLDQPTYPKS